MFIPEYIEDNQDLLIALVHRLLKIMKGYNNSKKQVIRTISMRMN